MTVAGSSPRLPGRLQTTTAAANASRPALQVNSFSGFSRRTLSPDKKLLPLPRVMMQLVLSGHVAACRARDVVQWSPKGRRPPKRRVGPTLVLGYEVEVVFKAVLSCSFGGRRRQKEGDVGSPSYVLVHLNLL